MAEVAPQAAGSTSPVAVTLYSFVSRGTYAWMIAGLLAVMTVIPGWIAFGPGERHCTSSASVPLAEFTCRIAFGAGAILMAGITVLAAVLARKGGSVV